MKIKKNWMLSLIVCLVGSCVVLGAFPSDEALLSEARKVVAHRSLLVKNFVRARDGAWFEWSRDTNPAVRHMLFDGRPMVVRGWAVLLASDIFTKDWAEQYSPDSAHCVLPLAVLAELQSELVKAVEESRDFSQELLAAFPDKLGDWWIEQKASVDNDILFTSTVTVGDKTYQYPWLMGMCQTQLLIDYLFEGILLNHSVIHGDYCNEAGDKVERNADTAELEERLVHVYASFIKKFLYPVFVAHEEGAGATRSFLDGLCLEQKGELGKNLTSTLNKSFSQAHDATAQKIFYGAESPVPYGSEVTLHVPYQHPLLFEVFEDA